MGDFNYVKHKSDRLNKLRACDSYIRNIFKPEEFSLEDTYKHFHKEPDFTRQNSRIDIIYVSDFFIKPIILDRKLHLYSKRGNSSLVYPCAYLSGFKMSFS